MSRLKLPAVVAALISCVAGCSYSSFVQNPNPLPLNAPSVSRDASRHALLYLSSIGGQAVTVYTYSNTRTHLIATLTGFNQPAGECVDKNGNVFITDGVTIYKYAHGGTKPLATLQDTYGGATSCSIDALSGDLAVTNSYHGSGYGGNVLIYPKAKMPPIEYTDAKLDTPRFCAYDGKGNLYVDGYWMQKNLNFRLAVLEKGASAFTNIKIKGTTLHSPGGVFWDDPYLLAIDQEFRGKDQSAIYELEISAGTAQVERAVPLRNTTDGEQLWKQGGNVIAPDGNSYVPIYAYPSGRLVRTITKDVYTPYGVVISQP